MRKNDEFRIDMINLDEAQKWICNISVIRDQNVYKYYEVYLDDEKQWDVLEYVEDEIQATTAKEKLHSKMVRIREEILEIERAIPFEIEKMEIESHVLFQHDPYGISEQSYIPFYLNGNYNVLFFYFRDPVDLFACVTDTGMPYPVLHLFKQAEIVHIDTLTRDYN